MPVIAKILIEEIAKEIAKTKKCFVYTVPTLKLGEDIERQLATMRSVLHHDVRHLATEARTLVDWRYHFRAHPWVYCGGAAALGFMLVRGRERSQSRRRPQEFAWLTH
jgi:ElaB/YqjD/DUF883 family membrane-anchored ribosome-binding protein